MATKQDETFEESLDRLSEIVGQLERGEAPLEEGLSLFEEGVKLTRRCHEMLTAAEARVQKFTQEEDGEVVLRPLDEGDEE